VRTEDQVAALFARANPVPTLDLLEPVESVDIDDLWDRLERPGETELRPARERRPRGPWPVHAMAAAALLVMVTIPALISLTDPEAAPTGQQPLAAPAELQAREFMTAANAHDGLAIRGMWALEHHDDFAPDGWVPLMDINRALGLEYLDVECVEQGPVTLDDQTTAASVRCSWVFQTDLTKALGLEPTPGDYFVYVSGYDIVRAVESWDDLTSWNESFEEFRAWVQRNHPDDEWTMFTSPDEYVDASDPRASIVYYDSFMSVEPESLALWERYVDEFVSEMGG
jgi:hypothetical protein